MHTPLPASRLFILLLLCLCFSLCFFYNVCQVRSTRFLTGQCLLYFLVYFQPCEQPAAVECMPKVKVGYLVYLIVYKLSNKTNTNRKMDQLAVT